MEVLTVKLQHLQD